MLQEGLLIPFYVKGEAISQVQITCNSTGGRKDCAAKSCWLPKIFNPGWETSCALLYFHTVRPANTAEPSTKHVRYVATAA